MRAHTHTSAHEALPLSSTTGASPVCAHMCMSAYVCERPVYMRAALKPHLLRHIHVHALAREADVHVHIFVHDADICAALKHYMSIAIHPHSLALSIAASMHGCLLQQLPLPTFM